MAIISRRLLNTPALGHAAAAAPGAVPLKPNAGDRDTLQPEQPTRSGIDVLKLNPKLRTLARARDLTFVTMNCSTLMITEVTSTSRQDETPDVPG